MLVVAGLHFLNAVAYAATLTFCCAYIGLKLRALYPRIAAASDYLAWLQLLDMCFYFIEHACIIDQLSHATAYPHLPPLTNAMSIMFLVVLVPTVLFALAGLVLVWANRGRIQQAGAVK